MLLPLVSGGTIRSVIKGADEVSELAEQTAKHGDELVEGAGSKIIRSADDINYGQSSLDKAFSKHSGDFGTYSDGSNVSKDLFRNDLDNMLETGLQKSGTYRTTSGTHVYNSSTRQWAFLMQMEISSQHLN